jgi:hypothetical protein
MVTFSRPDGNGRACQAPKLWNGSGMGNWNQVVVFFALTLVVSGALADTPRELSLHELQDPDLPTPSWGQPIREVFDVSPMENGDASQWPPRLSAPQIPEELLTSGRPDFGRDYRRLLQETDVKARIQGLRRLASRDNAEQAHYLWRQVAALHDRPTAREHALRQAIAAVPHDGVSAPVRESLAASWIALLETLAWHGDENGRLKTAASLLQAPPSVVVEQAALQHAQDALLNGGRTKTVLVPLNRLLELADMLSVTAEFGAGGAPLRALTIMRQYGDEAQVQFAEARLSAYETRLSKEPWNAGGEDPGLNVYGPVGTLLRDCLALNLWWRKTHRTGLCSPRVPMMEATNARERDDSSAAWPLHGA